MDTIKRLIRLWLPVFMWLGLIFWWSSIPHLAIATGAADFWTRKPAHVAEYAALFLLLYRACTLEKAAKSLWPNALTGGMLTIICAAFDEWHQHFVPSRHGSILDVGIDCLGILLGIGIIAWWNWWQRVTMYEDNL